MADLSVNEMLEMQCKLQDKYKAVWEPINRETGLNKWLWMIGETGEVIDILKKNGVNDACDDPKLRHDLIEEMADVLMYFHDTMLCFDISAEELQEIYTAKFERNLNRWKVE